MVQGERAGLPFPVPLPSAPAEQGRQVQRRNDSQYRRGILLVVGGIIAVARPRPGWLIVSLGLSLSGLVAGEFEPIARFMD